MILIFFHEWITRYLDGVCSVGVDSLLFNDEAFVDYRWMCVQWFSFVLCCCFRRNMKTCRKFIGFALCIWHKHIHSTKCSRWKWLWMLPFFRILIWFQRFELKAAICINNRVEEKIITPKHIHTNTNTRNGIHCRRVPERTDFNIHLAYDDTHPDIRRLSLCVCVCRCVRFSLSVLNWNARLNIKLGESC